MCLAPIPYIRYGPKNIKVSRFIKRSCADGFVPCGHCVECQKAYSSMWALRVIDELRYHNSFCFCTLTYANAPLGLSKRDLQLFIKRLRKSLEPIKIRYFACGEYGARNARPHYHIIIYGWCPNDLKLLKFDKRGNKIFMSSILSNLWHHGFVSVGTTLDEKSARYLCKYMSKELFDDYKNLTPPFLLMSRRPGIGLRSDDFDLSSLASSKIYRNGCYYSIPRYYLSRLDEDLFDSWRDLQFVPTIKSDEWFNDDLEEARKKAILLKSFK